MPNQQPQSLKEYLEIDVNGEYMQYYVGWLTSNKQKYQVPESQLLFYSKEDNVMGTTILAAHDDAIEVLPLLWEKIREKVVAEELGLEANGDAREDLLEDLKGIEEDYD